MTGRLALARSCRLWGVSRQSLYQRMSRHHARQQELAPVRRMVEDLRRWMPRLGTRKLYFLIKPQLQEAGIKLGRDALFDYLREQRLLIQPKRSYTKTTHSKHWMKKYPNRLKDRVIDRPEQVFVSDITYVESEEGVHYLSLVTDAASRKIMGHQLSHEMKARDVVKALKKAIKGRCSDGPLIHHSDRGVQYCASSYQQELRKHHIEPSMTDGYDCYQNALAERVNGILKQEFLVSKCPTFEDLRQMVDESIKIYNGLRPHLSLGMKCPDEVHNELSHLTVAETM